MNEEMMQEELSPEEAKAALGLSTRLSEQFMMSQAQMMQGEPTEAPESPEMAPESPEQPEVEEMDEEEENDGEERFKTLEKDVEDLKKSDLVRQITPAIREAVKEEMGALRKEIEKALDDEDEKTKTK